MRANESMARRGVWIAAAVALLFILGACSSGGGSSSGGSGSTGSGNGGSTGGTTESCGTAEACQNSALTVFDAVFPSMASALASSTVNDTGIACNFDGTLDITGTSSGSDPYTFNIAVAFSQCDSGTLQPTDEVVVDGTITMSGSFSSTGASTFDISSDALSVNGNVQGTPVAFSCPISMTVTYAVTPSFAYSFATSICGQSTNFSYP